MAPWRSAASWCRFATARRLDAHVGRWKQAEASGPVGYVLSLEGADSIVSMSHLERAYTQGLRAVGPAHYGPGIYAQGTNATGGIGARGRELLREMERLGILLDVTHLCDDSLREALDNFRGPVWASHSNCRSLVPHNRQFSDDQIRELIQRGAVIGAAFDAWMLVPGWVRGESTPERAGVTLETVVQSHRSHLSDRGQCPPLRHRIRPRRRVRPRTVSVGRPHDRRSRKTSRAVDVTWICRRGRRADCAWEFCALSQRRLAIVRRLGRGRLATRLRR